MVVEETFTVQNVDCEGLREASCLFQVMRWGVVESWVVCKLVRGLGGDLDGGQVGA